MWLRSSDMMTSETAREVSGRTGAGAEKARSLRVGGMRLGLCACVCLRGMVVQAREPHRGWFDQRLRGSAIRGPRVRERAARFSASVVAAEFEGGGCGGGDLPTIIATFAGETAAGCTRIVF